MLTLLLVCDGETEPLVAPLRNAGHRLFVAHRSEETRKVLAREGVDAILLHQPHRGTANSALAELKRFAPHTPVMLLRGRNQCDYAKPPGVTAVCCTDPADEMLLRAFPAFLGLLFSGTIKKRLSGPDQSRQIARQFFSTRE